LRLVKDKGIHAVYATLRVSIAIALVPIAVITFHYLNTNEDWLDYVVVCIVIILSATYIIYPFISDYSKLASYVMHLSYDRIVKPPKLESSAAVIELSESLSLLNKSWEKKQRELLEKINEIRLLFDAIPEILFIINESLVITKTNNTALEVFGKSLVGIGIRDIIDNKVLLGAIRWVLHDQKSKKVEIQVEEPIARDYQILVELYDSKDSGEKNLIIMMHDVTELKRTEKMLADFVANASHEIRTPLTSIIGIVETLDNTGWKDEEARKIFVPMITEQAYRMKSLIDDLLSLSSIERRLNTPPTELVSIKQVVEIVLKQLEWDAIQSEVSLNKSFPTKLPAVLGDFNELSQVLYNIISNAIKYGGKGKEVKIKIGVTKEIPKNHFKYNMEEAVYLSVSDQGEGISKEHIERLTERFYRIDKSRSKKLGGTGLGLAIVKQILLRHKGFLDVKSIVGEGSIFTIYLPVMKEEDVQEN
jgi:two-component system phosphate regulon sensor histidine kinase PhoR